MSAAVLGILLMGDIWLLAFGSVGEWKNRRSKISPYDYTIMDEQKVQ